MAKQPIERALARLQFLEQERVEVHRMLDTAGISRGTSSDLSIPARLSDLVRMNKPELAQQGMHVALDRAGVPPGKGADRIQWLVESRQKSHDAEQLLNELTRDLNSIADSLDQVEVPPANATRQRVEWLTESWKMARRRGEEVAEVLDAAGTSPKDGTNTQRVKTLINCVAALSERAEPIPEILRVLDSAMPTTGTIAQRVKALADAAGTEVYDVVSDHEKAQIREILNTAGIPHTGALVMRVQWLADKAAQLSSMKAIASESAEIRNLLDTYSLGPTLGVSNIQRLSNIMAHAKTTDVATENIEKITAFLDLPKDLSAAQRLETLSHHIIDSKAISDGRRHDLDRIATILGDVVDYSSVVQRVEHVVNSLKEFERDHTELQALLDEHSIDRETKYGNAPIARIRWVLDRPIAEGQFSSQLRRIEEMLDAESVGGAFESTAQRVENLCSRVLCAEKTATDHGRERASIVEMLDNACAFPPENAGSVSHLSLATRVKWLADQLEAADTREDKESVFKRHGEELSQITSTLNEAKIRPGSPAVRVRSLANIAENRRSDKDNAKDEVSDLRTTVKEMGNTIDEARKALSEVNAPFVGSIPARIRALRDELQTIGKILSDYRVPPLNGSLSERVNGIVDYWHNMQQDGQELTKALIFPPGESVQAIIYPADMPIGSVASNLKWLIDRVAALSNLKPNATIQGIEEARDNNYSRWQTVRRELAAIITWRNGMASRFDEGVVPIGEFQTRVEWVSAQYRDMKSTISLLHNDRDQLAQLFLEVGAAEFHNNKDRLRWLIDMYNQCQSSYKTLMNVRDRLEADAGKTVPVDLLANKALKKLGDIRRIVEGE